MTKSFILFIAFALAVGGAFGGVFAGGVALGKTQGGEIAFPQEANPLRQEIQNRSHRGGLTGVIETVDGNIVTVNTARSSVTATLVVDTKIRRFAEGTLSDLQPGMRVTLVGEPGLDGAVGSIVSGATGQSRTVREFGFHHIALEYGRRNSVGDGSTGSYEESPPPR